MKKQKEKTFYNNIWKRFSYCGSYPSEPWETENETG